VVKNSYAILVTSKNILSALSNVGGRVRLYQNVVKNAAQ
jgi:hypothetical protein